MADKKTIQVIIDGKIYVLSGENSESYLHDVADYLNHKIESYLEMIGVLLLLSKLKLYFA